MKEDEDVIDFGKWFKGKAKEGGEKESGMKEESRSGGLREREKEKAKER